MTRLLIASVTLLALQQPPISNGTVVTASAGIEQAIAAAAADTAPSWVAWKVPAVNGRSQSCCWYSSNDDRWYGCGLEPREADAPETRPAQPRGPVPLEGGTSLLILARVAEGKVERVRAFSDDCPLDAGGRTIRLVEDVTAEDSVRWLSRLAEPSQPSRLRRQAIFWIGESHGEAGFRTLRAMLDRETAPESKDVRRSLVQAISRSSSPEAVPALIAIARNDKDPATRGEAMRWIGQSKDPRAMKFLENVLMK